MMKWMDRVSVRVWNKEKMIHQSEHVKRCKYGHWIDQGSGIHDEEDRTQERYKEWTGNPFCDGCRVVDRESKDTRRLLGMCNQVCDGRHVENVRSFERCGKAYDL